ncbi:MAG: glycosyltransferase family 2 protein [Chitinophagaceae bacterium]|nr:glycosyltransferase family 2 protein [Chitinophagaceae bacterium]
MELDMQVHGSKSERTIFVHFQHDVAMDKVVPFFSVVVTTYNRGPLLGRALKSLQAQTETDWEAVIVDDGSTDDTKEIVQAFLVKDHRFRYFKTPPSGATPAKNKGMALSKGRYITFLDSDDEYRPDHLQRRRRFMEAHPEVLFLHGGITIIGDEYVPDRFDYGKKIHLSECAVGGTFVIAREVFTSLGEFNNIPLGSDADYLDNVLANGFLTAKLDAPTYIYHREHDNSITNNLMRLRRKEHDG